MYRKQTWLERLIEKQFGRKSTQVMEALLQADEFQGALHRVEATEVARRADIVRRRAEAPARHLEEAEKLHKRLQSAQHRLREARAALAEAEAEVKQVEVESLSAGILHEREMSDLTRQLVDSADPRIEAFIARLRDASNDVRAMPLDSWPTERWSEAWGTNVPAVIYSSKRASDAIAALDEACKQLAAMKLLAHTSDEVTAALHKISAHIAPALRACQKHVPELEAPAPTLH